MRQLRFFALFIAGFGVLSAAEPVERLKDVKTIYVAPFEGQNNPIAEMLQAKLISTLSKIHGISVVENEANADAILTGSGLLQSGVGEYGHTRYFLQAGMRLISKEGEVVLWADNISSNRFARSASSSFADNVAKSLARLIGDEAKK